MGKIFMKQSVILFLLLIVGNSEAKEFLVIDDISIKGDVIEYYIGRHSGSSISTPANWSEYKYDCSQNQFITTSSSGQHPDQSVADNICKQFNK